MGFQYSKKVDGKKKRITLPFDPTLMGFELKENKPCCLHFQKGQWKIRVQKAQDSRIFLMYRGNSGIVNQGDHRASNQQQFEAIISKYYGTDTVSSN